MKNGKIKLGRYIIEPKTSIDILNADEFNVIKFNTGKVYISKEPMELNKEKFWTTIFCDNKIISKVELSNAEEKYKMNYQTMNDNILKELRKHNNDFLKNELGIPSNESITGIEYDYAWGKIFSYYDNKSSETGIVIVYIYLWLYFKTSLEVKSNKSNYLHNHCRRQNFSVTDYYESSQNSVEEFIG